jgi:apoptosis-inducing factor 3
MFYPLIAENELREGLFEAKMAGEIKLLLIQHRAMTYVIENKCGHFGLPLDTGYLDGETIVCSQHGISFNLTNGEVANRPYENCDSIKTYTVVAREGFVGVELPSET